MQSIVVLVLVFISSCLSCAQHRDPYARLSGQSNQNRSAVSIEHKRCEIPTIKRASETDEYTIITQDTTPCIFATVAYVSKNQEAYAKRIPYTARESYVAINTLSTHPKIWAAFKTVEAARFYYEKNNHSAVVFLKPDESPSLQQMPRISSHDVQQS